MRLGSDWLRLHPLSPLLRAGRFVLLGVLVLADDVARVLDLRPGTAGLLLVALVVAGGVAGWWAWSTTGYRITAEEVELRTGLVFRRHRRVPVARLESIDIARPIFARVFGLAVVRLEAVSQGDSEVRLSYLDEKTAIRLSDDLRARLPGAPAPSSSGAADGPVEPPAPILQVPTGELVLASVAGRIVWAWPIPLVATAVLLVVVGPEAALAAAVSLGPAFGIGPLLVGLAEVERLYGFTLTESGRGLEIRRGFLNQMHQVVPLDRVQAAGLIEPLLWRRFGRVRLVVDVAGYRGGTQEDRRYSSVLLPIAPSDVADGVLGRVLTGLRLDQLTFVPAPGVTRWRAPLRWRTYATAWDDRFAVARHGLLRRHTGIVPHHKVQSLRVTQGPWQRALDLATLHLDTAGAQVRVRARHRGASDADRLAWASRSAAGS